MPVREVKLSLDTAALRKALNLTEAQLPDDATDDQINEVITGVKVPNASPDAPAAQNPPAGDLAPTGQEPTDPNHPPGFAGPGAEQGPPKANVPGGVTVDKEQWEAVNSELAVVRQEREAREKKEDQEFLKTAARSGKIPPARIDHYMTLMKADRDGTRTFIDGLAASLPMNEVGSLGELDDTLKASDYEESWLSPGERHRIENARKAVSEGRYGDVEPGSIVREA